MTIMVYARDRYLNPPAGLPLTDRITEVSISPDANWEAQVQGPSLDANADIVIRWGRSEGTGQDG